jgi:metallophosphoesterase (TIGR00282 family)
MKILFIGDVVGEVGRNAVAAVLPDLKIRENIDFTICNGENISHGKGIIKKHYDFLVDLGVNAITLGNHYDSKSEIEDFIVDSDRLIRPLNLIHSFPGEGSKVFDCNGKKIRVTNILCTAFMNKDVSAPYQTLIELIKEDKSDIHIVDLHGEATGEKQAIGYVFDGKITAILGTHTHVQTNDERLLPNGTAYISDVGFCGSSIGVLGFELNSVIDRTIYGKESRFNLLKDGDYIFNGVILDINDETNKVINIKKIRIDTYGKINC